MKRHGIALTGAAVEGKGDFPLLLKLIDARESLSVQVHPDDTHARQHEGKLGKSEAWVILHAEPGAKLVLGIQEGVSRKQLEDAMGHGSQVEALLRYVTVKAGDAFYIPAGMVHAIGAGITLYEIQQSSDVTYRFYDWNRHDQNGVKRVLHHSQALIVSNLDLHLNAVIPKPMPLKGKGNLEVLLDTPFFR